MKYLKYFLVFLVFTFTFAGLIQSVDARGADEPCSYLNPTKYVRDSSGSCILAPYIPVSQVVPQVVTATTVIPATINPSGNLSDVAVIFLLGILAFIAYKIFGGRFRQPRMKYRPRSYTQKPESFIDNESTVGRNSTVQEATDTWNGGYYDDDTKEKFK